MSNSLPRMNKNIDIIESQFLKSFVYMINNLHGNRYWFKKNTVVALKEPNFNKTFVGQLSSCIFSVVIIFIVEIQGFDIHIHSEIEVGSNFYSISLPSTERGILSTGIYLVHKTKKNIYIKGEKVNTYTWVDIDEEYSGLE